MQYRKNYPIDWQGQLQNKKGDKSIILEAIANQITLDLACAVFSASWG